MFRHVLSSTYSNNRLLRAALGSTLAFGLHQLTASNGEDADMCGIVGYLGDKNRAFDILRTGIKILENRGYDSCGKPRLSRRGDAPKRRTAHHQVRDLHAERRLHRPHHDLAGT